MKSFTNVHVIFNFAIGKKKNLVTRYILNGERDVFFAFLSSSIPCLGELDDIMYINPNLFSCLLSYSHPFSKF